jgi:NAD(P)-dependent dehydrogenase (short-subunit alcohol dehydrogenase family)
MFDFSGKTVLVTGGGAGIGRATALAFGKAGAQVVVAEINADRVRAVGEELKAQGTDALVLQADVTSEADVDKVAAGIDKRFGGLDVLVNNVGDYMGVIGAFADIKNDEIQKLYAVNLHQIFLVTRAMVPLLRRRAPGSSVISISSIEGFRGNPTGTVYGAFKAAVTGFTKSLALELAPEGIRVNLMAPETTHTPQLPINDILAPRFEEDKKRWIPLGRFGTPDDLAGGAMFLASPYSSWVTGTTLHIDGGALAAGGWYRAPDGSWTNLPVIKGNAFVDSLSGQGQG